MKATHFLTILLIARFLLYANAQSGYWQPKGFGLLPNGYQVYSISVVDDKVVWAVANSYYALAGDSVKSHTPRIIKTVDGGTTWQVYTPLNLYGRFSWKIQAFDSTTAYVSSNSHNNPVSEGRFLLKTVDGGSNWTNLPRTDGPGGTVFHFFNQKEGVAANFTSTSITVDSGVTWNPVQAFNLPTRLVGEFQIMFNDGGNKMATVGDTLWYGTSAARMWRSVNRGKAWQAYDIRAEHDASFSTAAFKDSKNGLTTAFFSQTGKVLDSVLLYTTNDGGETWSKLPSPPFKAIALSYVKGTKNSYFGSDVTDSLTWLRGFTHDGGLTWQTIRDTLSLSTASFLSPKLGWAGGYQDTIFGSSVTAPAMYKWVGVVSDADDINVLNSDLVILSPNPVSDKLTVDWSLMSGHTPQLIQILDVSGHFLLKNLGFENRYNQREVDVSGFSSGLYVLRIINDDNTTILKKFVIERK